MFFFFFKQKTAYEISTRDWSSDVCSSDLEGGVMQSYYVDEWKSRGILLEATFTPPAFGGAWLAGSGAEHQRALLGLRHIASIGVQLTDRSEGRVRLGSGG